MEIIKKCIDEILEDSILRWSKELILLSKKLKIQKSIIFRQARLHLPNFTLTELNEQFLPEKLVKSISIRLNFYNKDYAFYADKSGINQLSSNAIIKSGYISDVNQDFEIEFKQVDKEIGDFIEEKLHYLQSPRLDSITRFGMFLKGYEYPICYLSFTKITRYYRLHCVKNSLNDNIKSDDILNLARVYGGINLPKNSISKTISVSSKLLAKSKVKFMTTSLNPLLGFNGTSFSSSGFKVIGLCPVTYNYLNNSYMTIGFFT